MKHDTVTIIAGGPSARDVDLERVGGYVIGVNEAGFAAPQVDAIVSMDRMWTEHRWDRLVRRSGPTWLRRSAVQNCSDRWDGLTIFECDHTTNSFADHPGKLNGTNSGACALNLAYQFKPRRVFLIGYDMNRPKHGRAYWHTPYEWSHPRGGTTDGKYAVWAQQFFWPARAFEYIGTKVFNVSPTSAIPDFERITPKRYFEELAK